MPDPNWQFAPRHCAAQQTGHSPELAFSRIRLPAGFPQCTITVAGRNRNHDDCQRDIHQTRQALDLPHLRGSLHGSGIERALSPQPVQGPDRSVGRLRSADPDRLRQRPSAGERRGRQSRRAHLAPRRDAHAVRSDPARRDEHVDDDQRDGGLAARALHRHRRGARRRPRGAAGHDTERHHQGISVARHLRVSAGTVDAAHHRRDFVHDRGDAEMESDECLFLSSAGGRRDAGAGTGLRASYVDCGARHRESRRGRERLRRSGRPHPRSS